MKKSSFIIMFFLLTIVFISFFSCNDLLSSAFSKDPKNTSMATNFISVAGDTSIALSWTNPPGDYFEKALLLRKESGYPYACNDPGARIMYEGKNSSYTDTAVSAGITYYYALYTLNTGNIYSEYAPKTAKTISATFTETVRKRCIYLVGGSSDLNDPFGNLVAAIDAFDPETQTVYDNIATIPVPRYGCTASSAYGKIFIFGGLDEDITLVTDVDVLDICSSTWPEDVWSKAEPIPLSRYSLRSEVLENKIYVMGGSTSISPWPWAAMTDKNFCYDPNSNNWNTDESQIPKLTRPYMNFISGSYSGNIIYGIGRYGNQAGFHRYIHIHNIYGNYSQEKDDADMPIRAAPAGTLYSKSIPANNIDLTVFFILGGCSDSTTSYEPMKNATSGADPTVLNTCFYMKLPNATNDVVAMTGRNLNAARAYAEAEFYSDYVYVFCGLTPTATNAYERIQIDDALTFPTGWEQTTGTELSIRYAFDVTKVNL